MAATTAPRQLVGAKARLRSASAGLTIAAGVQLVASAVTSKVAATMLGATGVGIYAVVQAVANVVALLALGTGEALVRESGRRRALDGGADDRPLVRGAEVVCLSASSVVVALAIALREPLGRGLFGPGHTDTFLFAVAAGVTYAWVMVQVNCLVARRDVSRVSVALVLAALSTPMVALAGFRAWGIDGVGRVHLGSMLASLLTTALLARTATMRVRATLRTALGEIPGLLRYGVPHVTGTLLTASTLLVVPVIVRSQLGIDAAGFYRAAALVAAGMATLFTFVLNGDFASRIAEAATDRSQYALVMRTQLRSILLRGTVLVLSLSLLAPIVVRVLYANDFGPTADILPIMLLGQLIGVVALAVNLGIGARHGGGRMLCNAAVGGVATVASVTLVGRRGLDHVAAAFAAGQGLFLVSCVAMTLRADGAAPLRVIGRRPDSAMPQSRGASGR